MFMVLLKRTVFHLMLFFEIQGDLKTTNKIVSDTDVVWDFLDLGESDLEKNAGSLQALWKTGSDGG